ncbi:hypothetical protein [Deferrisoma camini]|uniref:hypothetical protein n=1 Tax=Deferrisoma camini TaxID=1035120 RepID=UPI00046CA704|nr:hypothetical protein [Deferrisoma camini]
MSRPPCLRCRHFYVTWDPRAPRGCRALGFKTRSVPGDEVRRISGRDCLFFEEKHPRRRG